MKTILALLAAALGMVLCSLPAGAAGTSKCLHVNGVTTWSVPHLLVNNERSETVTVTLQKVEYSPGSNKSWTVGPKTEQKFDLWGSGIRYDRIYVAGNGWVGFVALLPAYEAAECDKDYWAIRVKVYSKPQTVDGRVYHVEGGYRFK